MPKKEKTTIPESSISQLRIGKLSIRSHAFPSQDHVCFSHEILIQDDSKHTGG